MSGSIEDESVEVVDFSSPVQGRQGVMYPLTHWRREDVDIDFVMDVGDGELVVAPDLALLSGGKGMVLCVIGSILLINVVFIFVEMKLFSLHHDYTSAVMPVAFMVASIPLCIWLFRSIRYGSRIEPIVFNRKEGTVTHYGDDRVTALEWAKLKPFIRIVRAVGVAGATQVQLLVLAEVEEASRRVGREVVVGRGDVISAGALRYGFFEAYMGEALKNLPSFRLASFRMDWMQRMARSLWTVPVLGKSWLGERPWSFWIAVGSVINTVALLPLLAGELVAAKISLGPRGEATLGPWQKRFERLPVDSELRALARHHSGMVAPAKRCLFAALAIGCLLWLAIGVFWAVLIISKMW